MNIFVAATLPWTIAANNYVAANLRGRASPATASCSYGEPALDRVLCPKDGQKEHAGHNEFVGLDALSETLGDYNVPEEKRGAILRDIKPATGPIQDVSVDDIRKALRTHIASPVQANQILQQLSSHSHTADGSKGPGQPGSAPLMESDLDKRPAQAQRLSPDSMPFDTIYDVTDQELREEKEEAKEKEAQELELREEEEAREAEDAKKKAKEKEAQDLELREEEEAREAEDAKKKAKEKEVQDLEVQLDEFMGPRPNRQANAHRRDRPADDSAALEPIQEDEEEDLSDDAFQLVQDINLFVEQLKDESAKGPCLPKKGRRRARALLTRCTAEVEAPPSALRRACRRIKPAVVAEFHRRWGSATNRMEDLYKAFGIEFFKDEPDQGKMGRIVNQVLGMLEKIDLSCEGDYVVGDDVKELPLAYLRHLGLSIVEQFQGKNFEYAPEDEYKYNRKMYDEFFPPVFDRDVSTKELVQDMTNPSRPRLHAKMRDKTGDKLLETARGGWQKQKSQLDESLSSAAWQQCVKQCGEAVCAGVGSFKHSQKFEGAQCLFELADELRLSSASAS